ncbi:LEA type 2 family protein [Luteimonas yindakuii]|uniref:NDR1/HIN1-like protein n=1 Tax=Luteimonas yindakuii TaxID=2565782 RepID=UPI0011078583|nr:LEA type 2 family protein [Luteimonas yindakuii]QCU72664.1 LEA type 2 family protein [Luteimonas yindakuii]
MKRLLVLSVCLLFLIACGGGQVRRISEPTASIQQLTVAEDGDWSVVLRLQNYSSIPMRFDGLRLDLAIGDTAAGTLEAAPALQIGGESVDITTLALVPSVQARLLIADALASGRGVSYVLEGTITAAPADRGGAREYRIRRPGSLGPAPGLPGVLR